MAIKVNGEPRRVAAGAYLRLESGQRITLEPGVYHEFEPVTDECIVGEVSTANDDLHDNFFVNPDVGRYSVIEEDEPSIVELVHEMPGLKGDHRMSRSTEPLAP